MNKDPSVSIVIPNWDGLWLLKQFVGKIVDASNHYKGESEIIIFDNGSVDRSLSFIMDNFPDIRLLPNPDNIGFGKACNQSAKSACGELILFLNNDISVPEDFITLLVEDYNVADKPFALTCNAFNMDVDSSEKHSFFGSRILVREVDDGEIKQLWDMAPSVQLTETDYCSGAAFLCYRQLFLDLGGFDDLYGLAYFEDADLCARAKLSGYKNYTTGSTSYLHRVSSTSIKVENKFKEKLMFRNALRFHFRFSSRPMWFLYQTWTVALNKLGFIGAIKEIYFLFTEVYPYRLGPFEKFSNDEACSGDYFITPPLAGS